VPQVQARPGLEYGYGWSYARVDRGPGRDSVMSVRHNGGINGFQSCNLMIPEDGVAIIWLDNTSQDSEIQEAIAGLLYGRPLSPLARRSGRPSTRSSSGRVRTPQSGAIMS
jgi:CubicO group peptidase (beta-lactamase class C family)